MSTNNEYSVKVTAEMAGVIPSTLRTWERRYNIVQPDTSSGQRRYTDQQVEKLRLVQLLIENGHRIGDIANLDVPQLQRLVERVDETTQRFSAQILEALDQYDLRALDAALDRCMAQADLRRSAELVFVKVLEEIGNRWATGEFAVAQERLFTSALTTRLHVLLQQSSFASTRPVLLANVSGESHDLGLLMAGVVARLSGTSVRFLGSDIPAGEIGRLAEKLRSPSVASSFGYPDRSPERLIELAEALPKGTLLLAGGRGIAKVKAENVPSHVLLATSLSEMPRMLAASEVRMN